MINFLGLTIGFAASALLLMIINADLGYDKWVEGSENIVRIHSSKQSVDGRIEKSLRTPSMIGELLQGNYPDVVDTTRVWGGRLVLYSANDEPSYERIFFADKNFLEIFDWPVQTGDPYSPLQRPDSVVISQKAAVRLFGNVDAALGQTVKICCAYGTFDPKDHSITAVLAPSPGKSHLSFDFLATNPFPGGVGAPGWFHGWDQNIVYTYAKLKPDTPTEGFDRSLESLVNNHYLVQSNANIDQDAQPPLSLSAMPLEDIHLYSSEDGNDPVSRPGNIRLIQALVAVTALIFIIAIANYTNLMSVRVITRLHEFSLRKAIGAKNRHIAFDISTETFIVAAFSLLLGLTLVEISHKAIGNWLDLNLEVSFNEPQMIVSFAVMLLIVIITASAYPIYQLRTARPAHLMQQQNTHTTGGKSARQSFFIVAQFFIAAALIIATYIVLAQTRFALSFQPGFDTNNVLTVNGLAGLDTPTTERLKERIRRLPGVISTARSQATPGVDDSTLTVILNRIDQGNAQELVTVGLNHIDNDFAATYQINLIAGRLLNTDSFPGDAMVNDGQTQRGSALLNEAATKALGFASPAEAIGQVFTNEYNQTLTIAGVIADHHFHNVNSAVKPYIYTHQGAYWALSVRHDPTVLTELTYNIEAIWREYAPHIPFDYSFADQTFDDQYLNQRRQSNILFIASGLAIAIACVGLFGLAAFAAERRSKEISIRKILGAQVRHIISLLSWQFCRPVILANIIAWPIMAYVMHSWLNGFEAHIDLPFTPFLVAGSVTIGIAWISVSAKIMTAALQHPAIALKET
jgi:putative ABC transport system permease protein